MDVLSTIKDYIPEWVVSSLDYSTQAKLGAPVGLAVYDSLDAGLIAPPLSLLAAYDQSIYLISIGVRRADWDGNSTAKNTLTGYLTALEAKRATVSQSTLCRMTGYGCPVSGITALLNEVAGIITTSNLATVDKEKLTNIIHNNVTSVHWRNAMKYGVIGTAVVGVTYLGIKLWGRR